MSEYHVAGREVDEAMLNRLEYAINELATLEEDNELKDKSAKYDPPSLDTETIDRYRETFDRAREEMKDDGLTEETRDAFVDMLQDLYATSMLYSDSEEYIVDTRENRKDGYLQMTAAMDAAKDKETDASETQQEKAAKNQREQDEYYDRQQEYRQTAKIAMTWLDILDEGDTDHQREAREEYRERQQEREEDRNKLLPDD